MTFNEESIVIKILRTPHLATTPTIKFIVLDDIMVWEGYCVYVCLSDIVSLHLPNLVFKLPFLRCSGAKMTQFTTTIIFLTIFRSNL